MKAVIQRVSEASVTIDHNRVAEIKEGLLILLGIVATDEVDDINWLAKKIVNLRIFNDAEGVMNTAINATNGNIIAVSYTHLTLPTSPKV